MGLSPRVRGSHGRLPARPPHGGSIPACAGEPGSVCRAAPSRRVYPRVCGGTGVGVQGSAVSQGLSPRVRGNLDEVAVRRWICRSIPACAGEPPSASSAAGLRWVYPRVCGGTVPNVLLGVDDRGLSPRVRGNRHRRFALLAFLGSIPACAGEPGSPVIHVQGHMVYPRVCGGTV